MDNQKQDVTYTPSQLAEKLHISVPTLRKYSLLIEEAAHDTNYFPRNHQNVRAYSEQNLQDIQHLVDYSKEENLTLQKAAAHIFGDHQAVVTTEESGSAMPAVTDQKLNAQVKQLQTSVKQLQAQVDQLRARLDQIEQPNTTPKLATDPHDAKGDKSLKKAGKAGKSTLQKVDDSEKKAPTETSAAPVTKVEPTTEAPAKEKPESDLKFTEPTAAADDQSTAVETHRLVFEDEQEQADPSKGETSTDLTPATVAADHEDADQAHDGKKKSWWQKMLSK